MEEFPGRLKLPEDLKNLKIAELEELAAEIRNYMIRTVADTGGHLAPNLGVVELALALHSTFQSPRDRIIWDVGHQSYPHKLLTGRWDRFPTLRRYRGLSGFPKPAESEHDPFGTGHSSTSISAALGLALARDFYGGNYKVIAVIGDGAFTGGMAYEALNHAGHVKTDLIVILNDNKMSISSNVGAMSDYLGRIRSDPKYSRLKAEFEQMLNRVPLVGKKMVESAERLRGGLKYLITPGMIFEELGLTYFGPVDGHNIAALKRTLRQAARMKGPVLVHVLTEKGKGYHYAEAAPERFHGIGPFDLDNGLPRSKKKSLTYTEVFGNTMLKLAAENPKIVALTAAMAGGTGLSRFAELYPQRFYDVGIAEQHAAGLAAALAAGGLKPVFAVYSTFLQRAYDQMIHDVCLQKLPVVFAIDRAGIVGEDGETHQGIFDLCYLRSIPGMAVMAPRNEDELQHMLYTALHGAPGPSALRYPRDKGEGVALKEPHLLPWGQGELLREGKDLLIAAAGTVANAALAAAERLFNEEGIDAAVINARFVKPLDEKLILEWAARCGRLLTVEENTLVGGFGSAVLELLSKRGLVLPVRRLGIDDRFVEQGPRSLVLSLYGLDAEGIFREALSLAGAGAPGGAR
ncbi:MAG TPA: 1-deoxy-D-xylulose-5-phosphate synthase [Bacillota bacterium]|jgi:1-deoxy-D-xylulose-5-phosphate synthase|nr:1-deoxy-D-xylulose-5-phosphate synthase [Bacillota bacterium]HPZ11020.1 1-deoxy-D-xylulose-5-phosphate synthase [Bacillota bacterium]HQE09806.1 1-deoxy-D-xylulose-5-phosphate synthase [Bacillota bacterium]